MPLEQADQRHLTAAQGYLELEMYLEANDELERMTPEVHLFKEVLMVRCMIYYSLKKWELMQVVTKKLTEYSPDNTGYWINLAYATRRTESNEAARQILLGVLPTHAGHSMIYYNLACYECQLGNLEKAKVYLETALKIEPRCRTIALDDEDLQPLWDQLRIEM